MLPPESLQRRTPLIAALLRGQVPEFVLRAEADEASALADACVVHGVHGMLYHQFSSVPKQWAALPLLLRERLEYRARTDMAWELAHKAELTASLSALADAGVNVLILKGTALAYSLYPVASIRSRGDTDLLVRADDVPVLCDALARLGYERDTYSQGIGYEVNLTKKDRFGLVHVLDVHWRLSSSEVFAALFDWEEARRMSIAVPALGVHATCLGQVHALLHACVHRAVHFLSPYYVDGEPYLERNRLIWLYDIRLLASAFGAADWSMFVDLARARGVSALCLDALQAAVNLVGAAAPAETIVALARPKRSEISAQLLSDSAWRGAWVEFRAQRGYAARAKFLRDLLFPDREYMLRKYPGQPAWLLPYLYLRRVLGGVHRRMRHFR